MCETLILLILLILSKIRSQRSDIVVDLFSDEDRDEFIAFLQQSTINNQQSTIDNHQSNIDVN